MQLSTSASPAAMYSFFDQAHWARVQAERQRLGMDRDPSVVSVAHPLLDASVCDLDGHCFTVKAVQQRWQQGGYLSALLVDAGGHERRCVIENISSQDESILDGLAEFKNDYALML